MKQFKYADVCTRYIRFNDSELLSAQVELDRSGLERLFPLTVAEYREGFFISLPELETLEEIKPALKEAGFSEAFVNLLEKAIKEGNYVIRLDADGGEVEGVPEFNW